MKIFIFLGIQGVLGTFIIFVCGSSNANRKDAWYWPTFSAESTK